jgi:hypothetical protein
MNCCFSIHGLSYDFSGTPAHFYAMLVMTKELPKYLRTVARTVRFHLFVRDFLCGICVKDLSISCISLRVGIVVL